MIYLQGVAVSSHKLMLMEKILKTYRKQNWKWATMAFRDSWNRPKNLTKTPFTGWTTSVPVPCLGPNLTQQLDFVITAQKQNMFFSAFLSASPYNYHLLKQGISVSHQCLTDLNCIVLTNPAIDTMLLLIKSLGKLSGKKEKK